MRKQRGFTMLEVLISILVIMLGVLGLAGLQLLAISNTEAGRYQSLATTLASSMEAAMQGNIAYWGTPPPTITVNGTTITNGPAAYAGTCVGTVCSPTQMAYFDLLNWGTALASGLPSGQATITCPATASPAVCTLTLTWSEKNVALQAATGTETGSLATSTVSTHTYQALVSLI